MSSNALEIERSLGELAQRVKDLDEVPTPTEVHQVLTEYSVTAKMANREADLLLGVSMKLAQIPRDAQKIIALAMLAATPLFGDVTIMMALVMSWRDVAIISLLLSTAVTVFAEYFKHQDRSQNGLETVQDFVDMAERCTNDVKNMSIKYDDPTERNRVCEKPWRFAVGLLVLELAVCIASGQFLRFVKTCIFVAATLLVSGAIANHTAPRPAIVESTQLEKVIAIMSSSPILPSMIAACGAHGLPLVESIIDPANLLASAEKQLDIAKQRVAASEVVLEEACRKLLSKTRFASNVETAITGTAEEKVRSCQELAGNVGEMSGAITRSVAVATSKLGITSDDPQQVDVLENVANSTGDVLGGLIGMSASLASPQTGRSNSHNVFSDPNIGRLAQGFQGLHASWRRL
jgi:hypothetical protein